MKKWCFLLAALLLLPLSACGSSETLDRFYGRVEEVQRGPDGALSALVLQNEEGEREGILLTEETHVASAVEEVLTEAQFLEQTPLGTEVSGYFLEDVPGQTLSAQDGSEYSARTAHLLVVEEAKRPEGCTRPWSGSCGRTSSGPTYPLAARSCMCGTRKGACPARRTPGAGGSGTRTSPRFSSPGRCPRRRNSETRTQQAAPAGAYVRRGRLQRGGKAPCNSTGNGVKLAWKHKLRQAAGCWHTPRPCTSDGTTQHSNLRIAPQAYYTHLSFPLQGGGWAFGCASAWRNARRC